MDFRLKRLLEIAGKPEQIEEVRRDAKAHLPGFPTNGCGMFLSCLLRAAGIDVKRHALAQNLVDELEERGWERVDTTQGKPGDVGVTADLNGNGFTDHVYLLLGEAKAGAALVMDNQSSTPHRRNIGRVMVDFGVGGRDEPNGGRWRSEWARGTAAGCGGSPVGCKPAGM